MSVVCILRALAERDRWIGWSERDRAERLNWVVANTRFLTFPWIRVRNRRTRRCAASALVLSSNSASKRHSNVTCRANRRWLHEGLPQERHLACVIRIMLRQPVQAHVRG